MDEVGVHDEGKSAFALFDDSVCKHGLVVANGCTISLGEEGLEVFFGGRGVAHGGGTDSEDAVKVVPDVGVDDGFEFCEHSWGVEVGGSVRASDPADDGGDVAVEVQ